MEGQYQAYKFLRDEIASYDEDDTYQSTEQRKLKRLIATISKAYKKNVRLVRFGNGDFDSFFVGYHMIVLIKDDGCVLGLRAHTVWT